MYITFLKAFGLQAWNEQLRFNPQRPVLPMLIELTGSSLWLQDFVTLLFSIQLVDLVSVSVSEGDCTPFWIILFVSCFGCVSLLFQMTLAHV